jgi:hypothetical protein
MGEPLLAPAFFNTRESIMHAPLDGDLSDHEAAADDLEPSTFKTGESNMHAPLDGDISNHEAAADVSGTPISESSRASLSFVSDSPAHFRMTEADSDGHSADDPGPAKVIESDELIAQQKLVRRAKKRAREEQEATRLIEAAGQGIFTSAA